MDIAFIAIAAVGFISAALSVNFIEYLEKGAKAL
jgi:hypothetical protein